MNASNHDFLAAAAVPTNEQRIVSSLEQNGALLRSLDATLKSFEERLFKYINTLPKPTGKK